jgi:predicted dehydrogenase
VEAVKVGVVGCGNISGIYLENMQAMAPLEVVAVCDLDLARAQEVGGRCGLQAMTTTEMLETGDIDLVVNLTVPKAHAPVNDEFLLSGKHVYVEKPFALDVESGRRTLELAKAKGLRTGAAPDTFLGAGLQTCRELIDSGAIGEPIGAQAFMMCHGHESWHPSPEFYYEVGGGPLFDMGPYYLTALASLLGPVEAVSGMARATFDERQITSQPRFGKVVPVETPTNILGLLRFAGGALGQVSMSFDVWHHELPHIEIYGTEGSLSAPDPNGFGGPVRIRGRGESAWHEVPLTKSHATNSRGLGVQDMAIGIREGRPHRASGELAFHVLEVMEGILRAAEQRGEVAIDSAPGRPDLL